jgi:hypothetical protein
MGKTGAVFIGLAAIVLISLVSSISWFIGTRNEFIMLEQGVVAQYDQNRNNYDNFVKAVVETAQVSGKYAEDLGRITRDAIQGRYGPNGSQAVFQFLKEQNPTLDASIYKKIQQVIESGRLSFETNQKILIDKKRVYEVKMMQFPDSIVASISGFPRIDMKKFDIITSDRTEKAFETKRDEAIKF